jgi:hypothetical protein
MMRRIPVMIISMIIIGGFVYSSAQANDKEYKTLPIDKARHVQLSLSEKPRTMIEIKRMMSPFFTDKFLEGFIKENVHTTKEGSLTYGSDVANFYVPEEKQNDIETFTVDQKKIMVIHVAGRIDGPISMPAHPIVLWLATGPNGEKIDSIQYEIPDDVKTLMK